MHTEELRVRVRIEERERIGRELHDTVCQDLAGANMLLCSLEGRLRARSEGDAEAVARIADFVRGAMSYLRRISRGLEAVDIAAADLPEAINELCEETSRLYAIDCRWEPAGALPALTRDQATHLYCIAREGVSNAVRHGEATRITVALRIASSQAVFSVVDNGSGPATTSGGQKGAGLKIMRYRARQLNGALRLARNRPGGARLTCTFPGGVDLP